MTPQTAKIQFGDCPTDNKLIQMILDCIPREKFSDPLFKWLDPACGRGNFMIALIERLMISLTTYFPNPKKRHDHILTNMLYMVEINENHIVYLKEKFPNAHIYHTNFLDYIPTTKFDCIIGNPPFNSQGLKKVPTNTRSNKKNDGYTIWPLFIRRSISLLREKGLMSLFIPSIWMKPDKAQIYPLLTKYRLENIRCFTNTQNQPTVFMEPHKTPTCFFSLHKSHPTSIISLYDRSIKRYIPYIFSPPEPIPVFGASIFFKITSLR